MMPDVHVVVVDMGRDHRGPNQTLVSVQQQEYDGEVHVSMIPAVPAQSGGTFWSLIHAWMETGAAYGCCVTTSCMLPPTSIADRVKFCMEQDLSACYGNAIEVNSRGEVLTEEHLRPFKSEMIGLECIPPEAIMIDMKKFSDAGGFDYVLAGSHRPDAYLVAMAALGGRIAHVDKVVLSRILGGGRYGPGGVSPLAWVNENSVEFWKRLQFDRFVRQAQDFYKDQGWT